MIKQLSVLSALLLVAGCAHRSYESRVVTSDTQYPYRETTYGPGYSTYYGGYGPYYYLRDYDNTSKGAGARGLMYNRFAEYAQPVGAAVAVTDTETQTSKGAGARTLTGETPAVADKPVVTTTTTTETSTTSQGQGARTLTGTAETPAIVRDDAAFVREAGQAGLAEVRMGQLAQQNAQNQQFKDFGQRLVNDHSKANEELTRIASQKGFQMPTAMSSKAQDMIQHLSSLNGAQFDNECGRHAVEAHEKAIQLFRNEARAGGDSDLRAFAQKTLPTLEEHLRMAKELKKSSKED
jgi:putative membrane protein